MKIQKVPFDEQMVSTRLVALSPGAFAANRR